MKKAEYQRYLQSGHWWKTRDRKLAAVGNICEFQETDMSHGKFAYRGSRCDKRAREAHHKHYDSLYNEKDTDLEALCRFHHLVRHASYYQCETCCDSWDEPDDEAIDAAKAAIEAAGGISNVTPEQVLDHISCSYCNR